MLRAHTSLLSIPLLFALAGCGGPPPNTGGSGPSGEKSGDTSTSDTAKGDDTSDVSNVKSDPDTKDPEKKEEMVSRGISGPKEAGDKNAEGSPAPPPPQQAAVTTTPLSGKMTQQEIADILSKNAAYFNDCYTIGAGKGREFRGTVTVKATIGPSGAVTVAQVIKSTAQNAKVDTCVVDAFKKIKFPTPKDGATSVITFPMEFQGVEQVK